MGPEAATSGSRAIATIGVYGFDRDSFLATLREAGINLILDVRQRPGVRGREHAWANSRRLQAALAEARRESGGVALRRARRPGVPPLPRPAA